MVWTTAERTGAISPTRPVGASGGPDSFPTLALAQADAVRWLRATIAEMAAACPEVE